MFDFKLLGGILLIVGTSIGGGMLALPIATASSGILTSTLFLFLCWLIMTSGAFLVLEVNMRLPAGSNMISMAKATLGLPGQVFAWVVYLTLLYTLLSGYISGGSDVFDGLLHQLGINSATWVPAVLFTLSLSLVVYGGIKSVDYVNRGLMFGKLGVYVLLIFLIAPYITRPNWGEGSVQAVTGSIMVLVTSFGFATVVPTLREYYQSDARKLRLVVFYGSLIPLICYIAWDIVIMGVLQEGGHNKVLMSLAHSEQAITGLNKALSNVVHSSWISAFFSFFTSVCMLTAFLGVSMGLFDFLADGLHLKKSGRQGKVVLFLTYGPPLAVVLFKPGIYLKALSIAGICCVLLLLLLPVSMAWSGRRRGGDLGKGAIFLPGGYVSLCFIGVSAIVLLSFAVMSL